MSRKNFPEIYLSPLDLMVKQIPASERLEIILEYSELERTGRTGDGPLRRRAGEIFRTLQGKQSGFDAAYMSFVALSCHKLNSIEALMGPARPQALGMSEVLDKGGTLVPLLGTEFDDLCERIDGLAAPDLDDACPAP